MIAEVLPFLRTGAAIGAVVGIAIVNVGLAPQIYRQARDDDGPIIEVVVRSCLTCGWIALVGVAVGIATGLIAGGAAFWVSWNF